MSLVNWTIFIGCFAFQMGMSFWFLGAGFANTGLYMLYYLARKFIEKEKILLKGCVCLFAICMCVCERVCLSACVGVGVGEYIYMCAVSYTHLTLPTN